jgi:hypothetical protein
MTRGVSAQPLFDGTFSLDAVASVAAARVTQLHDEALATIAALADTWDSPAPVPAVEDAEPVTWCEPATWSAEPDEDELYAADEDDADDEVRVLPLSALPPLVLRPSRDRQLAAS